MTVWDNVIRLALVCSVMGFSCGFAGCVTETDQVLMGAVMSNELQTVKRDVEAGANINQRDSRSYTTLMVAVYYNQFQIAEYLLEQGADFNAQGNDGWTALMLAVHNGNVRMVKLLLQHNPNVTLVDDRGQTALDHAKNLKEEVIIGLLKTRSLSEK